MKKILLLGQGGYIGTSFSEYMKRYDGYNVESVSSLNNEWENADFSSYDAVYNVSGLAHANARQATEELYYKINGEVPVRMAEKAKREKVPLFIQMSSMIIYGNMSKLGESKAIDTNTPMEPEGVYGKSKIMAEKGLMALANDGFHVAIMRPPLIYSENAKDNFPRLVKFALHSPIFPKIENAQSMVYIDNFCELVKLIIDNHGEGFYYPQQEKYINTSEIVKDIALEANHCIAEWKIFNPILRLLSHRIGFIRKAFGNLTYKSDISEHYNGRYRVVSYSESIKRIVKYQKEKS